MINLNLNLLHQALRGLEQNQVSPKDRDFLIHFLKEVENSARTPDQAASTDARANILLTLESSGQPVPMTAPAPPKAEPRDIDLHRMLQEILTETGRMLPSLRDAHIFLYQSGRLSTEATLHEDQSQDQPWAKPRPGGLTYTVARLGQVIVIPDMQKHHLFADTSWSGSIAGFPLKIGPRVVGVLTASRSEAREFTPEELRILQALADQAAVTIEDIRRQHSTRQEARIDPLTGLFNRQALDDHLQDEFNSQVSFTLFRLGFDGFQTITESYGIQAGEYILKDLAVVIGKALRKTDFLARMSDAEWALVLDHTNPSTSQMVAERIHEFVAQRQFSLPNKTSQQVKVAIGAANYPENASSMEELLDAAGKALEQARSTAEAPIVFYGSSSTGETPIAE